MFEFVQAIDDTEEDHLQCLEGDRDGRHQGVGIIKAYEDLGMEVQFG